MLMESLHVVLEYDKKHVCVNNLHLVIDNNNSRPINTIMTITVLHLCIVNLESNNKQYKISLPITSWFRDMCTSLITWHNYKAQFTNDIICQGLEDSTSTISIHFLQTIVQFRFPPMALALMIGVDSQTQLP